MAKRREKGKIPHQEWPAIRTRYAAGESLASIARDYGCTGPAIRYIVNRPAEADGLAPAVAEPVRHPAPADSDAPAPAREDAPMPTPAPAPIDPELRWRVSSEIASFLVVFDSFLTENSAESYDQLLDATDRLMRVAARTRIELERARPSEHSRLRQGRPAARTRVAAS
ncbi:hypothetical protein [Azospirillum sp. sgz301742]